MDLKSRFLSYGRPEWLRLAALRADDLRIRAAPFFRLHPYGGSIRIRDVDFCSVVDRDIPVFYHRIPKNGNLSLVTSILQLTRHQELGSDLSSKRRFKAAATVLSSLRASEVKEIEFYFKFVVVRDPYDRALSAYLSKIVGKIDRGKPTRMDCYVHRQAMPSFAEFCRFLANGGLYADLHWSPQIDYLVYPKERYDFIARLESIDHDFKEIAKRLGYSSQTKGIVAEDPKHRTGAAARAAEFYTGELYELIYELYRRDFDAFGYPRRQA